VEAAGAEISHATATPDSTAVRTALWRALHLEVDAPPHVLDDRIGLQLAGPDSDWRQRPDMNEYATPGVRASIVARARFIEDLVTEQAGHGVRQYVLLGAGLDTFAQRRPEIASLIMVFEVDQPGPQAWKRQRLVELGFGIPEWLRLVPVDFETTSWWDRLLANGFDATEPTVVASLGVSMYLTREATAATLRQSAALASGSTLAMTFMRPVELVESEEQAMHRATDAAARASGTPFISYYPPNEILAMARDSGFKTAGHVSAADYAQRYFADRTDGLRPFTTEELLVPVELKRSRHVAVAIPEVRVSGIAVSPRQCARKTCRCHRRGGRSCTEPKAHERVSCAAISAPHPSSIGFGVSGRAWGPDGDLGMNLRAVEHKHGTAAAQHLDRRGVCRGSFGHDAAGPGTRCLVEKQPKGPHADPPASR
jgi:methyltransferase (TIGR00027 family)